jgi:hypothetical protein
MHCTPIVHLVPASSRSTLSCLSHARCACCSSLNEKSLQGCEAAAAELGTPSSDAHFDIDPCHYGYMQHKSQSTVWYQVSMLSHARALLNRAATSMQGFVQGMELTSRDRTRLQPPGAAVLAGTTTMWNDLCRMARNRLAYISY